jgi:hypothetical protein
LKAWKRNLQFLWWKRFISQIAEGWKVGYPMTILGLGRVRVFFVCNSFLGDQPQLNHMAGIYDSRGKHACRMCIYPTTTTIEYDSSIHCSRNSVNIRNSIEIVQEALDLRLYERVDSMKETLNQLRGKEQWLTFYNSKVALGGLLLEPLVGNEATIKRMKSNLESYYQLDIVAGKILTAQPIIDGLKADCITLKPISPFLYMEVSLIICNPIMLCL